MFAKSISYGPAHYILTFYIIFEVNCVLLGGRGCATSRQMRYIRILFFFSKTALSMLSKRGADLGRSRLVVHNTLLS